jgi:AcrR family transcriptional regulator
MLTIFAVLNLLNLLILEKKEIQEQRMKGYFVQATKELLKGEGLRSISVRNIADRAGYSYATLYNYFKDIKDLIFECVKDFQNECEEYVKQETKKFPKGHEKIKGITIAYMRFFIQYPGIFELFYLEKMSSIVNKQPTSEMICTFLERLCEEEWKSSIKQNLVTPVDAAITKNELSYISSGMLLHYLNRQFPSSYKEFIATMEIQITNALDKVMPLKK